MEILIVCLVVTAIIGFILYNLYLSRAAIVTNKLHSIKTKSTNNIRDGDVVKIKGKIIYLGKTLIAPVSGKKCVGYHLYLERNRRSIIDGYRTVGNWDDVIEEERYGDIIISIKKQYALIDSKLVKSFISKDKEYTTGIRNLPILVTTLLKNRGHSPTNFYAEYDTITLKEGTLQQGETIVAIGKATWKYAIEINIKIPNEKILVISAADNEPVYFSDDSFATSID